MNFFEGINFLNLGYLFYLIYSTIFGAEGGIGETEGYQSFLSSFQSFWAIFVVISSIVSLLFLIGIVYSYLRLREIRIAEAKFYGEPIVVESVEEKRNTRWEHIQVLILSENSNDWRQAIIEADAMLDDMIRLMGYPGDTLGERLRGIEKSDFETLDQAWEAHKVRNRIAHEGVSFQLDQREVRRVIDLYRQVFEEFFYI